MVIDWLSINEVVAPVRTVCYAVAALVMLWAALHSVRRGLFLWAVSVHLALGVILTAVLSLNGQLGAELRMLYTPTSLLMAVTALWTFFREQKPWGG